MTPVSLAVMLAAVPMIQVAPPVPVVVATPRSAPADVDRDALQLARRLVKIVDVDRVLDQMMVQFSPLFAHSVVTELLTHPQSAGGIHGLIDKGEGGQPRLEAILAQEFLLSVRRRYPDIDEDVARDYASRFTTAELQKVLEFYAAPVGVKMLALMPDMQAALSARGRDLGAAAGREAGERGMKRAMEEMVGASVAPKT